ncbi:MAG: carbohydrate binding domain-containing protein [Candidatus Bathycorpusculaceae bacterium]
MFCFGRIILKLNYYCSLIAGLIYVFSPIVFTRAVAGHIYYLIGYSLTPFLLTAFYKTQETKEKKIPYSIISGILFGLIGVQIQFFIMTFIILIILVLVNYKKLKNSLLSLILTAIIGSLLHLPWILPLVLTPATAVTSIGQTFLSYHEITSSPTLLESIRVLGYNIHPYSYLSLIAKGIIPRWILITNFLMPIIATIALIWGKKYTIGFGLILIIGIFLSKGISPPLEDIFILIFKYMPLIIFRELWHIAFLTIFSYTILTSISLDKITKVKKPKIRGVKAYALATILATIIIVSNGYPLLLGNFARYMQTYSLNEDYYNLYQTLQKDNAQYRILWLPSISPMKYNNNSLFGVDPLITYSPKPTFPQSIILQSPISRLNMFLTSTINWNITQRFGNVIGPFATRYIVQRNDFTSEYPHYVQLGLYLDLSKKWELNVTSNFIANQQDLILKNETADFKLYQNTNPSELIYAPTTIVYGTKDLSTLSQLAKISNLTDIAYLTDMTQLETDNPTFILKNDGFDLIPIITGTKIDPGSFATERDAQKGWVNSKYWFWYDYLFASTINNGAFSKTNSQLNIPIETKAPSEIWAKILKWQNGGKVKFTLNNEKENTIITLSSAFALQWTKLFDENSNKPCTLTISNIDGENYIDEILILNKQQADQKIASKLNNATIIYLIDPTSMETNIVKNPSFEESQEGYPLCWSTAEAGFTAVLENQTAYQGNFSLKVTTQINSAWHWSWIRSSEIPVASGEYQIITHLKQENANASHIAIEGLNKTTGTWVQLIQVPAGQEGSYDWKTYKTTLTINKNITMLRIALNAGWVLDKAKGNATTWFDDLLIIPEQSYSEGIYLHTNTSVTKNLKILKEGNYRISAEILGNVEITVANQTFNANSNQYEIVDIGSIFLRNSSQELKIKALENTHVGTLWIYTSTQDKAIEEIFRQNARQAKILEYTQENPALWKVKVNASSPFLLVFAAPYDSEWQAYVSNERCQPIPLYGFINGFWINQNGILEIIIEYEPQRWFYYGSIISVTILIACIAYVTYGWIKNKGMLKGVKKWLKQKSLSAEPRNT